MSAIHSENARRRLETATREAGELYRRMPEVFGQLTAIAEACASTLSNGGRILFCGNGGSAAESQHLATEFVVRLSSLRDRKALPALALTTDTSLLTACANDYGFDQVFARQVEAHLQAGNVLILLSTSGKSPNLIAAAKAAKARGGLTIAFLSEKLTPLDPLTDLALHIPSDSSQRVQEGHLWAGHMLVELVEQMLFDEPSAGSGVRP
jgi:D-sedoheptulose 7-phosphate isomerase